MWQYYDIGEGERERVHSASGLYCGGKENVNMLRREGESEHWHIYLS